MKRNFKFLLLSLFTLSVSPMIIDAATLSINGDSKESTATYEIVYNPEENPVDTINLEVSTVNTNLNYSISSDYGTCDDNLKCTLITTTLSSESKIATLTVTNTSAEKQKDNIVISGTISASKSIELAAGSTTTTTTTTQKILNTEAILSGINISVGNMDQTFASDIMEYTITGVKDTINSITLTPNCDNNCSWAITCPTGGCSVSNTRRVTLQNGANKVAINVTSEDGSANKTYILNVYRGEVVASSAYLSELKISDGTITPNFDSMTNDYTITVGLDVEKLDIITTTEDPSAEVIIKGNDKLIEGENTVTITVTSSDGENKQVYTILVNKEEIDEEEKEDDKKEVVTTPVKKKKNNTWLIILLSVLGLALIIVVFLIIFKKKKKKKDKNNKNDNDSSFQNNSKKEKLDELINDIEMENTETLNILNETTRSMNDEPKQDIDEALDDLMQTKRLELGDLNF